MKTTQKPYAERSRQRWTDVAMRRGAVVVLKEDGKSLREIATILGISYETARTDLRDARLADAGARV